MENTEQKSFDPEELQRWFAEFESERNENTAIGPMEPLMAEPEKAPEQDGGVQPDLPENIEEPVEKPQTENGENEKVSWQKNLLMYLHDLVYLLGALIVVSLLVLRVVVVSGTSMNKTLLDGDYLLVLSNTVYREPEAGDVVVISKESFDDGSPIVKRVIATEGQWVNIDFNLGLVSVGDSLDDMEVLDEPYVNTATTMREGVEFPVQVPEGCIFVLGDNRAVSRDSRSPEIGMIDEQEVLGRVIFLFLPGTNGTDAAGNPKENRDFGRIGVVE